MFIGFGIGVEDMNLSGSSELLLIITVIEIIIVGPFLFLQYLALRKMNDIYEYEFEADSNLVSVKG